MKTSNLLLIGLLSFLFVAMIGVDFTIKNAFENIDRNDPFYGYSRDTMKPFKYVKLVGDNFTLTQIQPGEQFEIRSMKFSESTTRFSVKWEVQSDTLYVKFERSIDNYVPFFNIESELTQKPGIYIFAPELSGVSSEEIICKLKGWPHGDFSVVQSGRGMHLVDNSFDNLSILSRKRGYVAVLSDNHLLNITVQVRDNSVFRVDKNVFKSFQIQADSTAAVTLPGNLLNKNINF